MFTVVLDAHKTEKSLSAIALDQCHEQNNTVVKGTGGAAGLTVEGQVLRILKTIDNQHHEQQSSSQNAFAKDVESLVGVIDEMGNPFLEESNDLLVLDNKTIVDASVAETVKNVQMY